MTNGTEKVRVGIAGLGRSGWGIHANALAHVDEQFAVVAVCDPDTKRQAEAVDRFDCMAYGTIDELVADNAVEIVVVATPSQLHVSDATKAMRAGKHVIVEKPMAPTLAGVDEMIAVAKETGQLLTVNQNYRYHADFLKVKEVIDSGVLGRIVQIRMTGNSFRRRWDWQTLKEYGGGDLNNKGAHPIDWAIHFFNDPDPDIYCHMETTPLFAGDAESHVKLIIKPNDGPLIDVELANCCTYPQDAWLVMGTQGTLVSRDRREIQWKYFDPAEAPLLVLDTKPTPDRGYNREELPWQEESYTVESSFGESMAPLYHDLYTAIRKGKPLSITPESVRRQVAILERCRELSPV
ncbi:MAG TPA: Gfo/Idh/MocA family oxidoreductase [Caldilineaceae bacterium]|nr:Gfo/Idh/MocA family oxidoreductase [Caldilineaceae bacterium]